MSQILSHVYPNMRDKFSSPNLMALSSVTEWYPGRCLLKSPCRL